MSSSPSMAKAGIATAGIATAGTAPARTSMEPRAVPEIAPFTYDTLTAPPAHGSIYATLTGAGSTPENAGENAATREARARQQGREQGMIEAGKNFAEQLTRERASLASAVAEFARDRAVYFQKVEGEVVTLALSIAAKILHREAQLDPLLLAGIVHVALEKIDGATSVRLRIHPQHAAEWRRFFSTQLEPSQLPEIVEDAAQPPDQCSLETSMGTAVIGLDVQLKEIEQGLMDLIATRPHAAS
jgi:flagellar biosynthesis/type III secretory pathway protein FliH